LEKFALSLHPDKTRLIEFGRFAAERRARRGVAKPETFNFLGFTHVVGLHGLATSYSREKRDEIGCEPCFEDLKQELAAAESRFVALCG
jgi:RNA-directed DNA polymerase